MGCGQSEAGKYSYTMSVPLRTSAKEKSKAIPVTVRGGRKVVRHRAVFLNRRALASVYRALVLQKKEFTLPCSDKG
jgi:hypothetical protein